MDLTTLLEGNVTYEVKFSGLSLFFTLRKPTNQEDLEYRRRSAKVAVKKGSVEPSDLALDAPLWLFNKVCTSAEYENGAGTRQALSDEEKSKVSNATKLQVIRRHRD